MGKQNNIVKFGVPGCSEVFRSVPECFGVLLFRCSGVPEFRSSGVLEFRSSGVPEFRGSGVPGFSTMREKIL